MRILVLTAASLFYLNALAGQADELWQARGADAANAQAAALAYAKLADQASTKRQKGENLWRAARGWLYFGGQLNQSDEKEKVFRRGFLSAQEGVALLENKAASMEEEEALAANHYFYAANLGRWGEARGIISSLGKVDDIRRSIDKVIKLGYDSLFDYGAYRALGRMYYRLPGLMGGDNDKAMDYLGRAFRNTLVPGKGVSRYGLNNIYYADVLADEGQKKKACAILREFAKQDPATLHPERIPETGQEVAMARKRMSSLGC